MLIVFGRRLYGKVLRVPGVFHVATQFFHIYYLPLAPLRSLLVLPNGEAMELPALSWSSVLMAWFRVCAWAVCIGAGIVASVWFGMNENAKASAALVIAALCVVCFFASYWTSKASVEQLEDLRRAGVPRNLLIEAEDVLRGRAEAQM